MKKSIVLLTIILTFCCCITAFAGTKTKRCGYRGMCSVDTTHCSNGTVYCDKHAAMYAKEQGYRVCGTFGCYARAGKGGYCSGHTCKYYGCDNGTRVRNIYCTKHSASSSSKTTYKKTYTFKKTNSTYKKSSSSVKMHYYCDPDDYDDPDEYADDAWGMDFDSYDDAYDYWEDW